MEGKVAGTWEGKDAEFIVRELTSGDMADIQDELANMGRYVYQGKTRVFKQEAKPGTAKLLTVMKVLVKAPFAVDLTAMRKLNIKTMDALYAKVSELSGYKTEEEEALGFSNSGTGIETAHPTPESLSASESTSSPNGTGGP